MNYLIKDELLELEENELVVEENESKEDEDCLIEDYDYYVPNDFVEKSKDELYKEFEKIIYKFSYDYSKKFIGVMIEDLISFGQIGLLENYGKFKISKTNKHLLLDKNEFQKYRQSFYIRHIKYRILKGIFRELGFQKTINNNVIFVQEPEFNDESEIDIFDSKQISYEESDIEKNDLDHILKKCLLNNIITKEELETLNKIVKNDSKISKLDLKIISKISKYCNNNNIKYNF